MEELKGNVQFQRRIIPASEDGPSQDEVILTPRRSGAEPPSEYATPTAELSTSGEEQAAVQQTPTSAKQQAGKPDGPHEIELKLAAAPPASPFDKVSSQLSTCRLHSHRLAAQARDRHVSGKSRQSAAGGPPTLSKLTWSHGCLQTATEQTATEQQPAPEGQQGQGSGGINASRRSIADAVRKGHSSTSPEDFASSTEGHLIMPPAKMHVQPAAAPSGAADPSRLISMDESVVAVEEPVAVESLVATSTAPGMEKPEEEPARATVAGLVRQSGQLPNAVLADPSIAAQLPAKEAGAQKEQSLQRCLESQLDGLQTIPGELMQPLSDCQPAPGNTFSGVKPGNTRTALASLSAQVKQRQAQ